MAPPQPGALINITVASYQFDNLFIDWGDGDVEPLTVQAVDQSQWDRSAPIALPDNAPAQHRYLSAGSYYIRIFQVSEQDGEGRRQRPQPRPPGERCPGGGRRRPVGRRRQPGGRRSERRHRRLLRGPHRAKAAVGARAARSPRPARPTSTSCRAASRSTSPTAPTSSTAPTSAPTEPMDDVAFGDLNLYFGRHRVRRQPRRRQENPVEGRVAACDESIKARVSLQVHRQGHRTVTWKVDGVMVGGVTEKEIGPSPSRSAVELKAHGPPQEGTWQSDGVAPRLRCDDRRRPPGHRRDQGQGQAQADPPDAEARQAGQPRRAAGHLGCGQDHPDPRA